MNRKLQFFTLMLLCCINFASAQGSINGASCTAYTTKTTVDGLSNNLVWDVYTEGSTLYAATAGGLDISTDGGNTFSSRKTTNGLAANVVTRVFAEGNQVYAVTNVSYNIYSLDISIDGGNTFTSRTMTNGLGSNNLRNVCAEGNKVYVATVNGLSISTDGGTTFTNRTTLNGLGANNIWNVYAEGDKVYASTNSGLSISTDGGTTFTNRTTTNGLGNNTVNHVYAEGNKVYAATNNGLSISTDGGTTFTNRTTENGSGLQSNTIYRVHAMGSTVYAKTSNNDLRISTDGGNTFTARTVPANVRGFYATGNTVYVGSLSGLSYCLASIPSTPTTLVATPGNGQLTISFTAVNNANSAPINYEYNLNGTDWTALSPADKISPITIPGLTNGVVYTILLRAVNAMGVSVASAAVTATPVPTIPSAPTSLVATLGNGQLEISFTAGANGGSTITNYEYKLGTTWIALSPANGTSPVTISGLTNGTAYTVSLRAKNAVGVSVASAAVTATPAPTIPSAPTSLVATPGDGQLEINFTAGNNGGSTITNYEYTIDGGTTWIALSPANGTSPVTISGLTNSTSYTILLRAVNAVGVSVASVAVSATPVTVPSAPTSLVATPGDGQLEISFTAGNNGGSTITNYEYTIDGGTTWIALSPANGISPVTIQGLTNGTSYSIQLRAVNAVGSRVSSNILSATLLNVITADPTLSTIKASPTSIASNGTSTSTITVQLKDGSNANLSTSVGTVVVTTTAGTISAVTDNANGTYSATLISTTTSGTATLGFNINGTTATNTATVTFTAVVTDTDGDGVLDNQEIIDGTSITNACKFILVSQSLPPSTAWNNADCDGDEVTNVQEIIDGTNPLKADTDGDGVTDGKEKADGTSGTNPCSFVLVSQTLTPSATWNNADCDGDEVTNVQEIIGGTDTLKADTDGDGVTDGKEKADGTSGTNPCSFVLVSQTLTPSAAWNNADCDGDEVTNAQEIIDGTDPLNRDTDFDGVPDGVEVTIGSNPLNPDTDGDGIADNVDSCPTVSNTNQQDIDGDSIGDVCDSDRDGDGVSNTSDNCPDAPNRDQADRDRDGKGDVCDTTELNVSQAITPNGDGINDTWVIYNIENHPGSSVRVFNRWGKEVFYSKNYKNDWDGNYQGSSEILPVSSYLYQIDLGGDDIIDAQGWIYITK